MSYQFSAKFQVRMCEPDGFTTMEKRFKSTAPTCEGAWASARRYVDGVARQWGGELIELTGPDLADPSMDYRITRRSEGERVLRRGLRLDDAGLLRSVELQHA